MAATYAKGLPEAVSAFAHAADRLTPEQQQQHDLAALRSSSFRADASSSSSSPASEFSRFAQQHAGPSSSSVQAHFGAQQAAAWERSQFVGGDSASAIPAQSPFAAPQDGDALVALLTGHDSVVEAVDGDWERQLAQEQQHQRSSPLPADPLASTSDPLLPDTRRRVNPGDMSPTSESLLLSVSNLSLAEQTYLRTLLASQDPAAMFQDYFSHGTYTDDVWTPTIANSGPLREVLDRAAAQDTGKGKGKARVDDEEGKAKAVRRLEMVLRHLNGQMGSTAERASWATSETRAGRLGADSSGSVENHRVHNAANPSTAADSRAADALSAHASYSTAATSNSFAAPSSLSSSAFVSFSPQSVAVHSPATLQYYSHQHHPVAASSSSEPLHDVQQQPVTATPHDHHRPATQPRTNSYAASSSSGESNGTDASYEEYAKEKEARMRSNEGGRFGPDFSSSRGLAVYGGGTPGAVDVTEGRTH